MTFLQCLSSIGKKATLALFIISCIALTAYAQKVAPQQEGRHYGDPGFSGEPINLNVVNADIRDILNYVTEQYGVNFVIDKSVGSVPVTVNVSEVPWNIALDSVLQSQDLGVQVNGPILRIAQRKTLADEAAVQSQIRSNQLDNSPLYTEFIRLNYARASGSLQSAAGGNSAQFQGGTTSGESAGGGTTGGSDKGILGIIGKRLSRRGSIETDARSNTLIVTDVRENIDAVRQLVSLLDQPEPQVEIEARIVVASRNFSRDIGVSKSPSASIGTVRHDRRNGAGFDQRNIRPESEVLPTVCFANRYGDWFNDRNFRNGSDQCADYPGETQGQAKTIATPRVTTLNNRSADNRKRTTDSDRNHSARTSGGGVTFTTHIRSVPLRLAVTPQITDVGMVSVKCRCRK